LSTKSDKARHITLSLTKSSLDVKGWESKLGGSMDLLRTFENLSTTHWVNSSSDSRNYILAHGKPFVKSRTAAQNTKSHDIGRIIAIVKFEQLLAYIETKLLRFVPQRLQVAGAKMTVRMIRIRKTFLQLKDAPIVGLQVLFVFCKRLSVKGNLVENIT
jgi:hypothetical protein